MYNNAPSITVTTLFTLPLYHFSALKLVGSSRVSRLSFKNTLSLFENMFFSPSQVSLSLPALWCVLSSAWPWFYRPSDWHHISTNEWAQTRGPIYQNHLFSFLFLCICSIAAKTILHEIEVISTIMTDFFIVSLINETVKMLIACVVWINLWFLLVRDGNVWVIFLKEELFFFFFWNVINYTALLRQWCWAALKSLTDWCIVLQLHT